MHISFWHSFSYKILLPSIISWENLAKVVKNSFSLHSACLSAFRTKVLKGKVRTRECDLGVEKAPSRETSPLTSWVTLLFC